MLINFPELYQAPPRVLGITVPIREENNTEKQCCGNENEYNAGIERERRKSESTGCTKILLKQIFLGISNGLQLLWKKNRSNDPKNEIVD